ncbi:alpha/beta hydrolase family protein [Arthrobacter sp. CG_A4]|uniref:alpha/beta hydrolase family protein n=1 Tax=Arthrobacter sp. CG_A4 TaxID=3071706 RepID=UPI002E13CA2D
MGALASAVWAARQATSATYRRRYDIVPLAISNDEIEFSAARNTLAPGEFGLQLSEGGPPAVIGPVVSLRDGKVTRRLLHRPAGLSLDSKGRWSGIVSVDPSSATADVVEIFVETPLGPAPAWMIDRGTDRWAIHVHGQGSDRTQTLRGVESATRMGLSSLVVSYRNDGEGPRSRDARSHLGESEWRDLEAALRFVAKRGGAECVVFGWSLGATMALNTVQRSSLAVMIKGLVMVSPVLVWEDVLRANARHQRCPQFLGSLVARLLAFNGFSRMSGMEAPLEVCSSDRARFNGALSIPVLILHNKNDWSVPFETSTRFTKAHEDLTELVEFDCSGHTQEWNSDPVGWNLAVRRWYENLFPPRPVGEQAAAESQ